MSDPDNTRNPLRSKLPKGFLSRIFGSVGVHAALVTLLLPQISDSASNVFAFAVLLGLYGAFFSVVFFPTLIMAALGSDSEKKKEQLGNLTSSLFAGACYISFPLAVVYAHTPTQEFFIFTILAFTFGAALQSTIFFLVLKYQASVHFCAAAFILPVFLIILRIFVV